MEERQDKYETVKPFQPFLYIYNVYIIFTYFCLFHSFCSPKMAAGSSFRKAELPSRLIKVHDTRIRHNRLVRATLK